MSTRLTNYGFLLQTGSGLELSSSCDHSPKHRPQVRRTHPGCAMCERGYATGNNQHTRRRCTRQVKFIISLCNNQIMFVFRAGLAALLVICTEAACPTVEPVPRTSPTARYITAPSGAASDRPCTIALTENFNITVSPGPINTDVTNGYRYRYGTEVNITCSSKTTDPLGLQDLLFLYTCSGNKNLRLWSDPSPSMTTMTLSSSSPAGDYWLGCWAASCTCDPSPDPATLNATNMWTECLEGPDDSTLITLVVGHPSPQPTNFWCVSDDWSTLECGWTLGSGSFSTVWSVSYWPPTQTNVSPIPCWKGEESSKTVKEGQEVNVTCSVDPILRYQSYVFQVSGDNVFGNIRENFTTRTDISIVKLLPINKLTVDTVPGNTTVLQVFWELPDRTKDMACEWRMRVQPKGDVWKAMDRLLEYAETMCQTSQMLLDGLHAFVIYTVQIQIRLKGSQYWNDERKVEAATPEDKPSQSPELTPGGYTTGDCRQKKCLTLYWKSVPAAAQNGEIIYYQVVTKENGTIVDNTTEKISGNSLAVDIGQRDDVTLVVELSAGTSVGFSSPPSRIYIPPRLQTPVPSDPEEVNVERQQSSMNGANATYMMTWSARPGLDPDDYVTVFWCKGYVFNPDDSRIMCLAGMEWTHLAPNITAYTIDLTDEIGRQWYFGVSRTRANVSRGVTWNRCVYDYIGVPSKPTLQASSKSETEMTVSWDFNMCDIAFLKGLPVTYEIFYSKTDSANPSCLGEGALNVTAEVGVKSVVVHNLVHGATYGVCMRILTARNASDVSDVKVETLSVESTDRSNVPVFAGVLVAIFALLMVIGILVLRRKLQLKATMFPSGNLWLPKPKTHGRWDVHIPVEESLGTGSSPRRTIQVSHDAEIHDRPVTLTGVHNVSSCVSPVLDSNPTSSEQRCGHKEILPPANMNPSSLTLVNGYFTPTVGKNDSADASTQPPGNDSRANRTGSENKSSLSAEYCTVQPVAHSASKTVETHRQIGDRGANGESDNTEDMVHESSSPSEAKGQELKHEPSSGPAGLVAGDLFAARCESGINDTTELQLLTVRLEPSLHGGYISESTLCKSYDVKISNTPRNRHVPDSLPSASQNVSRNDVVEGSTGVSARSQNSSKTLDCSPDGDDEQAVASDSASDVRNPRGEVESSGYLVLDNTVADKRTHSSNNTTTPYVTDLSKFLAERFTDKSQHHSVRNAQGSTFRLNGYLPHHELSDKMSLVSTTGMLTINEESPSLGRTDNVSWEDGHSGNVDINISVQEKGEEDKQAQPLMVISPSGYVMEAVHIERALTEEIGENWREIPPEEQPKPLMLISPGNVGYVLLDEEHRRMLTTLTGEILNDDKAGQPDNNLYLHSLAESSSGLSAELCPLN